MTHYISTKDAKESIKLFSKQQYIKHFFFFLMVWAFLTGNCVITKCGISLVKHNKGFWWKT